MATPTFEAVNKQDILKQNEKTKNFANIASDILNGSIRETKDNKKGKKQNQSKDKISKKSKKT